MRTLNIIGCGKVGKTLGKLFLQKKVFKIECILNSSLESSKQAVAYLGAGRPVGNYDELQLADVYMITSSDSHIAEVAKKLFEHKKLKKESILFHCSGFMPSDCMNASGQFSSKVASIHPIQSFNNENSAIKNISGSFCGVEGGAEALDLLIPAFNSIGCKTIKIESDKKSIYHAAAVFSSNYLNGILDVSLKSFEAAGISRADSYKIMEPIARSTISNIFSSTTAEALTGPIARGETNVVEKQFGDLQQWNHDIAEIYRIVGKRLIELSLKQGNADPGELKKILQLFTTEISPSFDLIMN